MANEAKLQLSLQITYPASGTPQLSYGPTRPGAFFATVSTAIGPTPGAISASAAGTIVNLSALPTPGLCLIRNYDPTNILEVGVYDPDTNEFYPMLEIYPFEAWPMRLSQFLGQEMGTASPGTGSTGSGVQLMVRGVGGAVECSVEAFNK